MSDMVMPYGKFKGKAIHEIPSGYLKWIAENINDVMLCEAADEEYQHREHYNAHFYE